ncbi:hypothetical protein DSCW_26190 [Desulfosarcina widdelii]|uniref:HTH cro/C1-type domain-containing protein n=2 Tax=Desulfosarcina widdelii TaxID=947919 RepID=A0A5K7YZR0_9BACT|nr:hypothetical protein DSCW_26190 [Desulfosarcina widdelii]
MVNIREKLVGIRSEAGLTQEKFAESLGYSRGYLADIEKGRTKPSRKFLEKVRQQYGVSIDWLVSDGVILDIIEWNKKNIGPTIIYIFAFTKEGIDRAEKDLYEYLSNFNILKIDAAGIKTANMFFKQLVKCEGTSLKLKEKLINLLFKKETLLVIKNLSLSKISHSSEIALGIHKSLFVEKLINKNGKPFIQRAPSPSSIILIDYPSYLEKNMERIGYYCTPIQASYGSNEAFYSGEYFVRGPD